MRMRKMKREEKLAEEERKRKENEEIYSAWLAKKNEQAKEKRMRTQTYPGCTLRRYSAPITHLMKSNINLKKQSSRSCGRKFTIDKLLVDATPQEKRTYRIYLGLGTE